MIRDVKGDYLADASYPMTLRNDAAHLHAHLVRSTSDDLSAYHDVYARACLTHGCLEAWKAIINGPNDGARQIIFEQPAIQLADALSQIAHGQFQTSCLQARAGVLTVLQWAEAGCPGTSPFESDIDRDAIWRVPEPLKEQLMELRKMRFGWVVCPESGHDRTPSEMPSQRDPDTGWITVTFGQGASSSDFPEVLLNEDQLTLFRQNRAWSEVLP